mmetsp:Transcript_41869/g.87503  ORF Transcript_41869/g.87503 Transcript_41869/m.87503 type:complete len:123 (-) Transcript_41869:658-1026(-)
MWCIDIKALDLAVLCAVGNRNQKDRPVFLVFLKNLQNRGGPSGGRLQCNVLVLTPSLHSFLYTDGFKYIFFYTGVFKHRMYCTKESVSVRYAQPVLSEERKNPTGKLPPPFFCEWQFNVEPA